MLRLLLFVSVLVFGTIAFSIPGISTKTYAPKDMIPVYANELDSIKTQLNFKYYFLNFCKPSGNNIKNQHENLGSKLLGESTQETPYIVQMKLDSHCQSLCQRKFEHDDVKNFAWMIEREYRVNLVIDDLPALYKTVGADVLANSHVGFPLGEKIGDKYYINNHLTFHIDYFPVDATETTSRIVGFRVEAQSLTSGKPPAEETPKSPADNTRILAEEASKPPAGETPKPPAGETPKLPAGETPKPPADNIPKSAADDTHKSAADETPKPPAGETPKPPAEEASKPPADDTPKPPAGETPKSAADETPTPKEASYCVVHGNKIPGAVPLSDLQILREGEIFFTYDVKWHKSTKAVGTRWDNYKTLGHEKVHWWSILNSFFINFILTLIIGYIMKRTVGNDIRQYNELRTSEDIQEDSGWKQLSRDVFRPPGKALLLSALIGTGVQVGTMFFLTLVFSCLGFAKQSERGSLITTVLLFYTFMGVFAGYYSARIYKMFNGPHWIKCTLVTAILYPLINFLVFYGVNILLVFEESSSALDPSVILPLIALWFGISIPLVFLGSLIGYKKQAVQNPSKYNPIPKFIKPQPWYLNANVLCLLGGLLPFGSVFIELVFIMASIWKHSFYYLFAFLFAALLILIITSAEISIVITYLQLCNGNHRVWWKAFFNTGSIGLYIFCYSIFYYYTDLEMIRFSSIVMYFGYMFAVSFTFFVFCGTIGFLASYWFIRNIYASIRID